MPRRGGPHGGIATGDLQLVETGYLGELTQLLQRLERPLRHQPKAGVLPCHSVWFGWANAYIIELFWSDPQEWSEERMLGLKAAAEPPVPVLAE